MPARLHKIKIGPEWGAQNWAKISIEKNTLTITAGVWPCFNRKVIQIKDCQVLLEEADIAVMLTREGTIDLASAISPYQGDGSLFYVDLLAWKEYEEWHIKVLESEPALTLPEMTPLELA